MRTAVVGHSPASPPAGLAVRWPAGAAGEALHRWDQQGEVRSGSAGAGRGSGAGGRAAARWAARNGVDAARIASTSRRSAARSPSTRVQIIARDRPVNQLLEQSQRAQLVVVGSRGHGELARMVLGSVSNALVHKAGCPLAIVQPSSVCVKQRPGRGWPGGSRPSSCITMSRKSATGLRPPRLWRSRSTHLPPRRSPRRVRQSRSSSRRPGRGAPPDAGQVGQFAVGGQRDATNPAVVVTHDPMWRS